MGVAKLDEAAFGDGPIGAEVKGLLRYKKAFIWARLKASEEIWRAHDVGFILENPAIALLNPR